MDADKRSNQQCDVDIPAGRVGLKGSLGMPEGARSLVLFAHGSGSSRMSPRNRQVADRLQAAKMGTLLFDLLTEEEDRFDRLTGNLRFDIDLLTERLIAATRWVRTQAFGRSLTLGYFGASTGAAAALRAAALEPDVRAIVSRGGRPDLAAEVLPRVSSPTLLIVGGEDDVVINLNRRAFDILRCEKKLEIIPGATHLFKELGALDQVVRLAEIWFQKYLSLENPVVAVPGGKEVMDWEGPPPAD